MGFEDACIELWRGILERKGIPKQLDLKQFAVKPPWEMTREQQGVALTKSETLVLFSSVILHDIGMMINDLAHNYKDDKKVQDFVKELLKYFGNIFERRLLEA